MVGWALPLVSRGSNVKKDTTDLVVLSVTFHVEHHEYRRSAAGCKAISHSRSVLPWAAQVVSSAKAKTSEHWGLLSSRSSMYKSQRRGCKDVISLLRLQNYLNSIAPIEVMII